MEGISHIINKLDKTMNYINSLKIYCEKVRDNRIEDLKTDDIIKQLSISIDEIYSALKEIIHIKSQYKRTESFKDIIQYLKDSYMVSDKCIDKIIFLNECCKEIYSKQRSCKKQLINELPKIIDILEDVVDELSDCLTYYLT